MYAKIRVFSCIPVRETSGIKSMQSKTPKTLTKPAINVWSFSLYAAASSWSFPAHVITPRFCFWLRTQRQHFIVHQTYKKVQQAATVSAKLLTDAVKQCKRCFFLNFYLKAKRSHRPSKSQIHTESHLWTCSRLCHLKTAEWDEGEEKRIWVHLTSNINPIKMKITRLKTMSAWFWIKNSWLKKG